MKGGKQAKAKSVFDTVKPEERDFFFNYIAKKVRNNNKKLKDIEKLEEDKKNNKDLKVEQLEKIASKEDVYATIRDYERIINLWQEAKKDAVKEQLATLIQEDALIIVLEHLAENQDSLYLLTKQHDSTHNLAKQLHPKINEQQKKKDQPWVGIQIQQQQQPQQQQQVVFVEEPIQFTENTPAQFEQPIIEQPLPEPTEPIQVQEEHFVLTKVNEKSAQKKQPEEVQEEPQVEPIETNKNEQREYKGGNNRRQYDNNRNYDNRNHNEHRPQHRHHDNDRQKEVEEPVDDGFTTIEPRRPPQKHYNKRGAFNNDRGNDRNDGNERREDGDRPYKNRDNRDNRENRDNRPRNKQNISGKRQADVVQYVAKE